MDSPDIAAAIRDAREVAERIESLDPGHNGGWYFCEILQAWLAVIRERRALARLRQERGDATDAE